jgi:transcriptional regulator with XRE-family HTH domain
MAPEDDVGMTVGNLICDLRLARGWSQGRLADALVSNSGRNTVTRETISRWETGYVACPDAFWLRHLAAVLQVPLQILEYEKLDRREFLTDLAATSIAPLVAADLIHSGFTTAIGGHGPDGDEWLAKLDMYGRDYMSAGAAEIQKRLTADLLVIQQQLDRPELWDAAAKLMTLYGKTFPGADGTKAIRWYRMAASAADRAERSTSQVWVRGRAAIALGYEGASLGVAQSFANDALAISDRPSLGRLNAIMAMAHVASLRGEKQEALDHLAEGRRVFDLAGSSEQESDYAVPEWRMHVFTSLLLARLGEEREAIEEQEAGLKLLPKSLPRFATHLEMHRGLMLARAGNRTEGIAYARSALHELPPEKHSLTLRLLMAEIERPPPVV